MKKTLKEELIEAINKSDVSERILLRLLSEITDNSQKDNKDDKEINELVNDIIKQARESEVYIIDKYSDWAEGYELDTLEQCLEHCKLPESVIKYVKDNTEDYEFIEELFNRAVVKNEVAAFQLAEGQGYCNYADAYITMTADYKIAKKYFHDNLCEMAWALEESEREYVYDNHLYVIGNKLGEKFIERYLEELEFDYNVDGLNKLVELYKGESKEEPETDDIFGVMDFSAVKRYNISKRDLVVDIIEYVQTNGISICEVDMPVSVSKFAELSGCRDEEIQKIYKIAADKAEQHNIAYMGLSDDVIVLLRDYEETCKFLDKLISENQIVLEEFTINRGSNYKAMAFFIKYLSDKLGRKAEDCWTEMVEMLSTLKKDNIDINDAVKKVLESTSGLIYKAITLEKLYPYAWETYKIEENLKDLYKTL